MSTYCNQAVTQFVRFIRTDYR